MGIRYYAYAFDGDLTSAVMADPWAYLSSDPLADAWGFEPHACLATPTFQQRLPERDLLYLDKAWHELQLLTGPWSVGGSERPSFRMFEGNVALLDAYTWEPWIRALAPGELAPISDDLKELSAEADVGLSLRRAGGRPGDVPWVLHYLHAASSFVEGLVRDGRGLVYRIG